MKQFVLVLALLFTMGAHAAYNFGVVVNNEEYQIYRSAKLGAKGLSYLKGHLKKKGLPFPKTIVYLNKMGGIGFGFAYEERNLQGKYGYKWHHIYLDGHTPNKDKFFQVLDMVLKEENQPVLFHCYGGRHRTGMMAMALRYIQGGEWVDGPMRRMRVFPRMRSPLLNPAEQEYAKFNRAMFRFTNVRFIRGLQDDDRFQELIDFRRDDLQMPSVRLENHP